MTNSQGTQLSRRTFLRLTVTLAGGAFAVACTPARRPMAIQEAASLTVADHGLPQPAPAIAPPATGEAALTTFLALSALLTGVEALDSTLGAVYLAALPASEGVGLDDLYAQAGFGPAAAPATMAELEAAGLFGDEGLRTRADQIIEMWYTGKYTDAEGNTVVVTHTGALAWQVLDFTKATTLCGAPYFWAEPAAEAVW